MTTTQRQPFHLTVSVLAMAALGTSQNPCPSWQTGVALPQGRSDAQAALAPNGDIVVIGGNVNPTFPFATNTCVRFSETTQQWTAAPAMSIERSNFGVAKDYLGRIYAISGFTNAQPAFTATCERLDLSSPNPSWQPIANIPTALGYARAVALPGGTSILVVGGQDPSGPNSNVVYLFNVITGVWSTETPSIYSHSLHGVACTTSGTVYATGDTGPWSIESRDLLTGAWTNLGTTPIPGNQIGACVADQFGDVFVMGGLEGGAAHAEVWRYQSRNNTWFQCGDLPQPTNNMACVISNSHKLYLIGGDPGTGSVRLDTVHFAQLSGLPGASAIPFGSGCAGSVQLTPELRAASLPVLNTNYSMEVTNMPAGLQVALGVLGFGALPLPVSLGTIGMPGCYLLVSNDILSAFATLSQSFTWTVPIPGNPACAGIELFTQSLVFDPTGAPIALYGSNGLRAGLGF